MFTAVRGNVTPPSSNMNMLNVSASWVERCAFWYPHPSWFPEIAGSNMILQQTRASQNIFQTVGFYANQAKYYNYTANTCKGN
uniref:SCP domain-containing protein n=1 Tax=Mesocestoides corti TaxID=53468 RepID=A0A5K3G137_MESCO